MKKLEKCIELCANRSNLTTGEAEASLKLIKNGQYRDSVDKEDIEFARFMIGGIGAK
jgi:hypothetical protein